MAAEESILDKEVRRAPNDLGRKRVPVGRSMGNWFPAAVASTPEKNTTRIVGSTFIMTHPRYRQALWLLALLPLAAFAWEKDKPATPPVIPPNPNHLPKVLLIDTHVHFHDRGAGDLDKVAEWMKSNNVQRVINHPLRQSLPRNEQEHAQRLANYAQYKGRIDRFCIIYPEDVETVDAAVTILTREKKDGAIGFGEHYGTKLMFDDPKNMRLYEACEKVGLPVMFHMDRNQNLDDKGLPRLEHVLQAYPKCILIAHSDWWKNLGDGTCGRLLTTYPNLYADISCTVGRSAIGKDKKMARDFFIRHADKLLFGTDSGWWSFGKPPMPEFSLIDELKLPKEVKDKICHLNMERLFPTPSR